MKAFLLYPDRDFDPTLLLSRRDRSYARQKEPGLDLHQALPWNHAALNQDLGLDIVLNTMAGGDGFLLEVALVGLLNGVSELDVIRYRQDVLRDCLRHGPTLRRTYDIVVEALKAERKHYWSPMSRYPAGTLSHAVEVLDIFVPALRKLRALADRNIGLFNSQGFSRLFEMLRAELSDAYFDEIDDHLKRLKFKGGVLVSAQLGKGNKATNYVLRKPHRKDLGWFARLWPTTEGYTSYLDPRDEAGARALSELRDRGVNLVANALAQSMDHISSFFQMLRTELAFYVGCLNLYGHLEKLGAPVCFPKPTALRDENLSFSGLYDVCLAISMNRKPVGNDLESAGKDFIVITGANTGGKSTFLRSLGLAQLMMQAGVFVPAAAFSAEVRTTLFSHFKREEDAAMESGKLDEELNRMSELVEHLRPGAMILMNESFAATNEREGSEIAMQITTALLEKGVKVGYVTHLHQFAHRMDQKKLPNALFLRAERQPDGTRTFRLIEAAPLQTSYGEDLYANVFGGDERAPESRRLSAAR
ncbi:MutS-related protein [Bradyrhizobium sp. CCBAU 51627]|uniref:MutS-related protein n=1 Tax=Bradyrhizobium sp. CCBAU 51627 TaxID=1325088 RepID=UPI0023067791|nr:DNA mismatch repair protein MutS [Bradyrhizobium sp. CCBAU 51627]